MSQKERSFDAVSLRVMWARLISITDEGVSALVRTSFSPIVSESFDLSVIVLDAEGHSMAQGTQSIPSFTGCAPATLQHMLERFPPETLRPGDVVATNDPWMGTGHIFDINVMRPVFRRGRIVAYVISVTHLPDIGGTGYGASSTTQFEEGLLIPATKIVEGGTVNRFIVELIEANTRVPDQVLGDIMANVTCTELSARQLLEFMDEYGIDDLAPLSAAIRTQSEQAVRQGISRMRDGRYTNEFPIEGVDEPAKLACQIDVRGDSIHVDLAGTSAAVRRGMNSPLCFTNAYANFAIKCLAAPQVPNNEGSTQPVTVTAPAGCILNPDRPFPTGAKHTSGYFVMPLIFGALADASPETAQADSGMINVFNCQGVHRDGMPISTMYFASGGFGAMSRHDGLPTMSHPANNTGVSVEMWERMTSLALEKKELVPDSGGPGAARGGLGQATVMKNESGNPFTVHLMGFRTEFAAQGLHGGGAGHLREARINGELVDPKARLKLMPGDVMSRIEAGGGGYGEPFKRPPEQVLADVVNGYVSVEGALRDYGVDVDLEQMTARRR